MAYSVVKQYLSMGSTSRWWRWGIKFTTSLRRFEFSWLGSLKQQDPIYSRRDRVVRVTKVWGAKLKSPLCRTPRSLLDSLSSRPPSLQHQEQSRWALLPPYNKPWPNCSRRRTAQKQSYQAWIFCHKDQSLHCP